PPEPHAVLRPPGPVLQPGPQTPQGREPGDHLRGHRPVQEHQRQPGPSDRGSGPAAGRGPIPRLHRAGVRVPGGGRGGGAGLLRDADTAMYRAKAHGRARCEIFDEKMLARAQEQLRLETDLHLAMEREEFHVVYQPIIELETDRLRGFEALLRWRHPERGLIPPTKFIPLAEETGLIVPLGNLIFTEACRRLRHWHDLDPRFRELTLAVNLSLRQIYSADLEDEIVAIVGAAGLDPTPLPFELTA